MIHTLFYIYMKYCVFGILISNLFLSVRLSKVVEFSESRLNQYVSFYVEIGHNNMECTLLDCFDDFNKYLLGKRKVLWL